MNKILFLIQSITKRFNLYELSMENSDIKEYLTRTAPLCASKSVLQRFCVETIFSATGIVTPSITKVGISNHIRDALFY